MSRPNESRPGAAGSPAYRKLKIFLASPEDVKKDRDQIKRVVDQINRELSDERRLILEVKDWQEVAPAMGRPEAVILDQLPIEEWDLFIGLLWHRFGTPTGGLNPQSGHRFESGTQEEFELAYSAWRQTAKPQIMFYRCMRRYDPEQVDPDQLKRVTEFFLNFAPEGRYPGLMRSYKTTEELKELVRSHLIRCVQKVDDPSEVMPSRVTIQRKEYIFIPSGPFMMGSTRSHLASLEKEYRDTSTILHEYPAHEIDLEGYYISRFPVTQRDYQMFIDATDHPIPYRDDEVSRPYNWDRETRTCPEGKDDDPVVLVSWHDAQSYCRWLGGRLPTEAEWEKAARGTDGREWPWGNVWQTGLCNAGDSHLGTSPVGRFSPVGDSPYGVAEMAGNVWEWCSSLREPYPYRREDGREAPGAPGERVLRGGSFGADRFWVRSALRNSADPRDYGFNIGFRVAFSRPPRHD